MKITNRVFALDSSKGSYAYLILGDEIILIDSGRLDQRKGILKELQAMQIKAEDIKHLLLTHHDLDHIGNAGFLQNLSGCKVWASKQDMPYICREIRRPGIKRIIESVVKAEIPKNMNVYPPTAKVGEIEVIPTPGHTPGHVCLLYQDILFAGDLVHISKKRVDPYPAFWNWDTPTLKESIKKITSLPFSIICPAHGRPVTKSELLKWMVNI